MYFHCRTKPVLYTIAETVEQSNRKLIAGIGPNLHFMPWLQEQNKVIGNLLYFIVRTNPVIYVKVKRAEQKKKQIGY